MIVLPEKLVNMSPYDPAVDQYRVKLDANESYMSLPRSIKEKIAEAILNLDFNRYPDPAATKTRMLAAHLYGVEPECVAAGNGSDELISVLVNSFCAKGGKLMVLEPDFSMYRFYAELCELCVVNSKKDDAFLITPDDIIESAKREKPQILIFSNPCNPGGRGFVREEVLRIVKELPDILIIADEAYMDFWNESVLADCTSFDNLLVLKTMSKAFAMAAMRLGFAIGNANLIEQINKARSPYNVNALTQAAAEIALNDTSWARQQAAEIVERKRELERKVGKLCEIYDEISVLPSYTNFVVIKTNYASEIYKRLLAKSICVRCFAKYSFLRITTGNEHENELFLTELEAILKEGL